MEDCCGRPLLPHLGDIGPYKSRRPCCCSSRPFLFNEGSNFPVKSISSSPLDVFGFRTKCCWCVPLKVASVLICLLTFIWATLELLTAEKFLKRLIDDKDIVFFLKIVYWVISIGLMIAAAILLLGIMLEKYLFVNIYVWYVLVFTCLVVAVHLAGSIFAIVKMDAVTKRFAIKLALATLWYALVFYFLLIVNSFKSNLW